MTPRSSPDPASPDEALAQAFPPLLRLRLGFEALDYVMPPASIGGLWHGVLDNTLNHMNPTVWRRLCKPPRPAHLHAGFSDMPTGYAIEARHPPGIVAIPGDSLELDLTLIGEACDDVATVLDAFAAAGEAGLGKGRGRAHLVRCDLVGVENSEGLPETPKVPPMPSAVLVALTSPLRLRRNREFITPKSFRAAHFIDAALSRAYLLASIRGKRWLQPPSVPGCRAEKLQIWYTDAHRWSASQGDEIDLAGIMGSFVLPLAGLDAAWAPLWWAQWVQLGAMTSAGLGALRLHPLGT